MNNNKSPNRRGAGRNEKSFKKSFQNESNKKPSPSKFNKDLKDKKKFNTSPSFLRKKNTKPIEKKEGIRLNKYIANSGICSRREADLFIQNGVVKVNGKIITEFGYQVMPGDEVFFDGRYIRPEKNVYVLLNKPKSYISTTKDEKARKTVMDLVANASPYRLYPVGRLDRQTTGVLLLTNDGDLTKKLTHPSHEVKKIYHVTLNKKVSVSDFDQLLEGIRFEEGIAKVDKVSYIEGSPKNEVGVEIHIGWNRIVRRMFEKLGYEVEKLDRVMFAGLTKKNLKRGYWRILTELEVNNLKML
ncbi:rRNA pseudouridine synthase [Apibacter muscae]|uniref:pseudouridine synthase n=1 Tax=Apibacter muscae TaxID=2509004 RepID=UPI0011AC9731|nr:pseudouridine synthase [Apibacter muscae]TWP31003.1 rRNA pseudouridine synthase [Apibacter muscae]